MKKKYHLLCVSGALAATLTAGIVLTACDDGFEIVTPSANAEDVSTCPEIVWTAESGATLYHVEIASDGAYENVVREGKTTGISYTVGNALAHATQYHLRVTALKEESDKTVSLNSAETVFKTEAAHDTDAPDYTAARTLYDFESFENSEALREEFPRHVDGNEIGVNLVNGGLNGSKAMEIDYAAGNKGWGGVMCKLPADKKVWSGAKGIRMWVKGDGRGLNIEVRVGKRGYQSWAATFSVNNSDACYVSIPFSAFDDIGGGDGIWDLAGITRFWLFFTGGSDSKAIIDDISIGSDENYTTDTRGEIEASRYAPAGVYDSFDEYRSDEEMEEKWTFESMGQYTLTESPFSTGYALELGPQSAWATARLNLPNYDFTQLQSIRFKASAGTYVIQLETSVGGVFEKEDILVSVSGDEAGVNISDLVPRVGTEGGVKLIRQLVIGVKNKNSMTVYIDDVTFSEEPFAAKDYTPEVGVADAFEYASDSEMEKVWSFENMGNYTIVDSPFSTGKALELTPNSAWATARLSYPNVSFKGITSICFKASAGTYVIQLETKEGGVFEKENIVVARDGDEAGVNLADLTLRAGTQGTLASIRCLVIGFNGANDKIRVIDDLTFSDETFAPKDYAPKAGVFDNFEDYSSDADLQAVWNGDGTTLSLETAGALAGTKSLKAVGSGWSAITFNYPNVAFDGIKSLRFKASAGTYSVRLVSTAWVSYKKDVVVAVTGDEAGVNIADLVADNGSTLTGTVQQLYIGFTGSMGGTLFDDFMYSGEKWEEPDYTAGLIEDFEGLTSETVGNLWKPNALADVSVDEEESGNRRLKIENKNKGQQTITLDGSYFTKYDYTNTIGFRFKFSAANNVPELTIQFGSYLNVYTISRQIYGAGNNVAEIVVLYDAMKLADGSAGALDKSKANYLVIYITQWLESGFVAYLDDFEFLTTESYTPETVMIDDFSSYADSDAVSAAWHPNSCTAALDGGAMKVTTTSGWNGLQYNFAVAGGLGSSDDFQNCYAISFDVTAGTDVSLTVKLQRWSNAKEATVSVKAGEATRVVVYLNRLTGENDWSDMIFNYLTIGWTYYGVTDITFDNIAFLRG